MFKFRALYLLILSVILSSSYSALAQTWFTKGNHSCSEQSLKEKSFLDAIKKGDEKLIEQFLKKGANPNLKDDCNIPVITYAAHKVRPDILQLLIKSGANVNAIDAFDNQTPLLWVINGFNYKWKDRTENLYKSLQMLISNGADVNLTDKSKKSPLISAVLLEEEQVTKILLDAGANINYKDDEGRTAYSYAAQIGNKNLKKILVEAGAGTTIDISEYKELYGVNAFFQAAADGRTDVVEAMLRAGTNVNMVNASKVTALMRASENSTVDLLISAGADVNMRDNAGYTVLIWAAAFGKSDVVLKLIAAGADVNAKNFEGKTSLNFARNQVIISALIKAGARGKGQ